MTEIKTIYARQGDLLIDCIENAPQPLVATTAPTTIAGSHDGAHVLPAGVEYAQDGRNHYVRAPKGAELTHVSRHKPVTLAAGQTYAIWPQIERRGEGDVDVED